MTEKNPSSAQPPETIRYTISWPVALHRRLRRVAYLRQVATATLVREAVTRYLDEIAPRDLPPDAPGGGASGGTLPPPR